VDLIVQLSLETTRRDGQAHRLRRVSEIIALSPGERETGYATTHVFTSDAAGNATPAVLPEEYRALAECGFDLAGYLSAENPSMNRVRS
jgi:pilus assembly protein CpaF